MKCHNEKVHNLIKMQEYWTQQEMHSNEYNEIYET